MKPNYGNNMIGIMTFTIRKPRIMHFKFSTIVRNQRNKRKKVEHNLELIEVAKVKQG